MDVRKTWEKSEGKYIILKFIPICCIYLHEPKKKKKKKFKYNIFKIIKIES